MFTYWHNSLNFKCLNVKTDLRVYEKEGRVEMFSVINIMSEMRSFNLYWSCLSLLYPSRKLRRSEEASVEHTAVVRSICLLLSGTFLLPSTILQPLIPAASKPNKINTNTNFSLRISASQQQAARVSDNLLCLYRMRYQTVRLVLRQQLVRLMPFQTAVMETDVCSVTSCSFAPVVTACRCLWLCLAVPAPNVASIEVPAQRGLIVWLLDSLVEIPLHFLPDLRARVSCDMVFWREQRPDVL